eukprot:scaffold2051_cov389-Prasinococcus_capsulatus_cf.AAC.15
MNWGWWCLPRGRSTCCAAPHSNARNVIQATFLEGGLAPPKLLLRAAADLWRRYLSSAACI